MDRRYKSFEQEIRFRATTRDVARLRDLAKRAEMTASALLRTLIADAYRAAHPEKP